MRAARDRAVPTTNAGYRALLGWLRGFGEIGCVGSKAPVPTVRPWPGTRLTKGVQVIEVRCPNRQVRRRHGMTDVVDAIAAADDSLPAISRVAMRELAQRVLALDAQHKTVTDRSDGSVPPPPPTWWRRKASDPTPRQPC